MKQIKTTDIPDYELWYLTFGWVFDNYGSYQNVWFVVAGFALVSLVSIWTMPGQVKPQNGILE